MVYHAIPYRHRAAGQSPAGQPPPDQSAGQWMAIRQATRQASRRQASGWPSARPPGRPAAVRPVNGHPPGHPAGQPPGRPVDGHPPGHPAGHPPPGQWMAIRQATRQATHRQATRKGWPYYTRCVPLVERSYIVGPPLAGGLATGLSSGDQPSASQPSGDQPSTGLSSGDQPSAGPPGRPVDGHPPGHPAGQSPSGHPPPGHPQGVALLYAMRAAGGAVVYSRATPCGWPGDWPVVG
jgi:hypothetical protein